MQIRWSRLFGLGLAILGLVVLAKSMPELVAFVKSIENIRPCATPEERTTGLIAFAVVALFILALTRLILQNQRRS